MRRDRIVVIDLEATCWEDNVTPEGQQAEIIEIGVCNLDLRTHQPSDKRSIMVTPVRSEISPFCTQLTTITPELVEAEGVPFEEAITTLAEAYGTRERAWASWGNWDKRFLRAQCEAFDAPYPFPDAHVNIKQLFADLYQVRRRNLGRSLKRAGITFEGTPHRGDDDAWHTALLLAHLLEKFGGQVLDHLWEG